MSVKSSAVFVTADGRQRVVVVAMKPQLRGRIRRTVTTLLEQGAEVIVLGLRSDKDFAVGLDHPGLTIELLEPSSVYLMFVKREQRAAAKRQRKRETLDRSPPILNGGRFSRGLMFSFRRASGTTQKNIGHLLLGLKSAFKFANKCPSGISRGARSFRTVLGKATRRLIRASRTTLVWAAKPLQSHKTSPSPNEMVPDGSNELGRFPAADHLGFLIRGFVRALRFRVRRLVRALRFRVRRLVRAHEIRKKGLLFVRAQLMPWHRMTRWVDFWRKSRKRALDLRPNIVISSDLPGLVGASLAAKALGIPHVHDCHELYLESTNLRDIERRALTPIERRYMRRADAVVFVNESIRREYAERYGVDGTVIRNCADRSDIRPGQDLYGLTGQPPDAKLVLYQGGFSEGRGLEVVVEAVAQFPEHVHLVLMGYGPLEQELRALCRAHEVDDRVTFVAAVPPEQLLGTTASATVGLVPYQPVSRNNRLALPNKIFEYTAVGLPVVVSAIPELIRIADQGVGLTYDPFDPADLARAVSTLLSPGVFEDAQASSREWGRSNSWEIEQQKLIEVWKHLVLSGPATSTVSQ